VECRVGKGSADVECRLGKGSASAKCILVAGSLQECLRGCGVNLEVLISGEYQTLGGHSGRPSE
jgi:hypothetical protein